MTRTSCRCLYLSQNDGIYGVGRGELALELSGVALGGAGQHDDLLTRDAAASALGMRATTQRLSLDAITTALVFNAQRGLAEWRSRRRAH